MHANKHLITIAGPSCVGKTPLEKSLRILYPELDKQLTRLIPYNSRGRRPVETDGVEYHFRSREQIYRLKETKNLLIIEARGDLHGFDFDEMKNILGHSNAFYEGNTFMALRIMEAARSGRIPVLSIFVSPFSQSELRKLKTQMNLSQLRLHIINHMMQKLVRRADNFGIKITEKIHKNLEHRARDTWQELNMACKFNYVIVNHDGEDSAHWQDVYNLKGDAQKAVSSLAKIIYSQPDAPFEDWRDFKIEDLD
jgi:guanylate kinase